MGYTRFIPEPVAPSRPFYVQSQSPIFMPDGFCGFPCCSGVLLRVRIRQSFPSKRGAIWALSLLGLDFLVVVEKICGSQPLDGRLHLDLPRRID